jgi:LemA protein
MNHGWKETQNKDRKYRGGFSMLIVIAVIVIIALYLITSYNRLVKMRNRIKESFAAIDVYLQNRVDALTKIAETVIAYATHERDTLTQVTRLRAGLSDSQSTEEKLKIYAEMEKTLGGINIQAESYPELKANDNYIHLQRTINDLEEKLSASRRTYNANVTSYNTMIGAIPMNLLAGPFGFSAENLLEIAESKKADVDMKSLLRG